MYCSTYVFECKKRNRHKKVQIINLLISLFKKAIAQVIINSIKVLRNNVSLYLKC